MPKIHVPAAPRQVAELTLANLILLLRGENIQGAYDAGAVYGAARRWWRQTEQGLGGTAITQVLDPLDFAQLLCLALEISFCRDEASNLMLGAVLIEVTLSSVEDKLHKRNLELRLRKFICRNEHYLA